MSSTSCSAATSSLLSAASLSALPKAVDDEEPPLSLAALSARSTSPTCLFAAISSELQVAESTAAGTVW